MPPGPAYNLLCAAHAFADILGNAARIRAAQLEARTAQVLPRKGKSLQKTSSTNSRDDVPIKLATRTAPVLPESEPSSAQAGPSVARQAAEVPQSPPPQPLSPSKVKQAEPPEVNAPLLLDVEAHPSKAQSQLVHVERDQPPSASVTQAIDIQLRPAVAPTGAEDYASATVIPAEPIHIRKLQSSKVPASRIGRLFHYGGISSSDLRDDNSDVYCRACCVLGLWCCFGDVEAFYTVFRGPVILRGDDGGEHQKAGCEAYSNARRCIEAWPIYEHSRFEEPSLRLLTVLTTLQIAKFSLQRLRISSGEFKTARTICQIGRWR